MVSAKTKKTGFTVTSLMHTSLEKNGNLVSRTSSSNAPMKASHVYNLNLQASDEVIIIKYVVNESSLYVKPDEQFEEGQKKSEKLELNGYAVLKAAHIKAWKKIWDGADVKIEGDVAAQQGIRFCIFQLWQTYTGDDERLNIGPKGFTEKNMEAARIGIQKLIASRFI